MENTGSIIARLWVVRTKAPPPITLTKSLPRIDRNLGTQVYIEQQNLERTYIVICNRQQVQSLPLSSEKIYQHLQVEHPLQMSDPAYEQE